MESQITLTKWDEFISEGAFSFSQDIPSILRTIRMSCKHLVQKTPDTLSQVFLLEIDCAIFYINLHEL